MSKMRSTGRRLGLLGLSMAVTVALALRLGPEPPTQANVGPRDEPSAWSLPAHEAQGRVEQAYQSLRKRSPFGEESAPKASTQPTDSKGWRLCGVVHGGDGLTALIESGGVLARVRIGETLPDGGTLVSIQSDRIEVQSEQGAQLFKLYSPAS